MNNNKFICLLWLLCCAFSAQSHQLSTAYLSGQLDASHRLEGYLQVPLAALNHDMVMDTDHNGQLTWGEVTLQRVAISSWLQNSLKINSNQEACPTTIDGPLQADSHFNQGYLHIPVQAQCSNHATLSITYTGLHAHDSNHKLLVNVSAPANRQPSHHSSVITVDEPTFKIDLTSSSGYNTFTSYLKQGVIHILIGYDHILFLFCLLLATFFTPSKNNEQNTSHQHMLWATITMITLFTLAHSLTLTLTALQWIQLPSRWVEVGIAATVLLTAIHNMVPFIKKLSLVTFGFGLLHGMGFAGVLGELGLPADNQLLPVLSFNLGVELGQLLLLVVALPLLLLINKTPKNGLYFMRFSSSCIALMAMFWIYQRI